MKQFLIDKYTRLIECVDRDMESAGKFYYLELKARRDIYTEILKDLNKL